jgi:hypothetical protein
LTEIIYGWIKYNKKICVGVIVVVTAATADVAGYICTFSASVWPGSVVGIATGHRLDSSGIESQWG